jgi:protein Tob/BTG
MREEIAAAVVFITRLVKKNEKLSKEQVQKFSGKLSEILKDRFKNHWYQDKPMKGQAYRCIRINEFEPIDPVLEKAATESGLKYSDLNLPPELTVWVDPHEVCCRFGELKGSYCILASFKDGHGETFAHTVDIDNALQDAKVKKEAAVTKITGCHRQNHNNNHNLNDKSHSYKPKLLQQGNSLGTPARKRHGSGRINKIAEPKKSVHKLNHFAPSFHPSSRFHWVRGADLVKA